MLRAFLFVGIGGFAGSMARYGVSLLVQKAYSQPFPLATFIINIVGCFVIGLLYGVAQKNSTIGGDMWLIAATGFCGGFTTFSAFALENNILFSKQQNGVALAYTIASVMIGILLCRWGVKLAS
jgi:crcB protein